jgi:ferrous-iron efflux pump FieF
MAEAARITNAGSWPERAVGYWQQVSFLQVQGFTLALAVLWLGPRTYAALQSTSLGLMADAASLWIDTIFDALIFFALRAVARSSSFSYPYGTGKFEAIAGALVAASLTISAVVFLILAAVRLRQPVEVDHAGLGVALIGLSLAVNLGLLRLTRRFDNGRSQVVRGWRRAYQLDCGLKLFELVSIPLAVSFGPSLAWLDAAVAVLVATAMLAWAFAIAKSSTLELVDRALEEKAQIAILRGLADSFDVYGEIVDIRSRRVGGRAEVEIILGFEGSLRWSEVQGAAEHVAARVRSELPDALVRVLPANPRLWEGETTSLPRPARELVPA